jgi:HSP20 family protein
MTLLAHHSTSPVSEMLQWLDTVSPFRGTWSDSFIPVEQYAEEGRYVVRADLPGIDPDKDVTVTIDNDILTIHGERREEHHDKHHSEVRYGSFSRQFQLPKGCKSDDVSATYAAGVLQVSLPVADVVAEPTRIPSARAGE